MQGKVVVITGSTSGIGAVAARKLAAQGARLVLVARDRARGEKLLQELGNVSPGVAHSVHYGDLSSLEDVKRLARDIASAEPKIDVLINNAGAIFTERRTTKEGLERTFALNHMSYFLLTLGLKSSLLAAAPSRVVNTASGAHRRAHLDFNNLQSEKRFRPFPTYALTKLCNVLFTRALSRRWADQGIAVNCLHPGFVATRFADESGGWFAFVVGLLKRFFAISEEEGARTIVYLATSPEVAGISGLYFDESRPATPSLQAQDDAAAEKLWAKSEDLAQRRN